MISDSLGSWHVACDGIRLVRGLRWQQSCWEMYFLEGLGLIP
jgi:hypothetical protein